MIAATMMHPTSQRVADGQTSLNVGCAPAHRRSYRAVSGFAGEAALLQGASLVLPHLD